MDFMLLNLPWLDIISKLILITVIICVIALFIIVIVIYVLDRIQTTHAIRRNYPVIGRFRYWFEHLGHFFRQYFFAFDREELPFNRAQRSWVYRAAKNIDNTVAFGSTYNLKTPGAIIFSNCSFPSLQQDVSPHGAITIGKNCQHPYTTNRFFHISGMSYGAISKPAVQALSNGAHKAKCWLNTGEGGLSPYHLEGNCDIIFQIGTAKYGVRDEDGALSEEKLKKVAAHEQVKMFELKLSQGAKPGKGGILPAIKVSEEIAAIRGIPVGTASLSPNRHEDIKTIPQLLDQIEKIRRITGKPTGFKTVLGNDKWLREFCQEVVARGPSSAPDFITIDSADGGTGAAPASLIDYMGLPISESLPIAVDILMEYGLKEQVKVIASGKLINPPEVAWALCMGADFVTSARGFMFALGCIQALQCNKGTCPTGITTHDKKLQRGLDTTNKTERVAKYALNMEKEVGIIAHSCGANCAGMLRREHARIIMESGRSKSLQEIYPYQKSAQGVSKNQ